MVCWKISFPCGFHLNDLIAWTKDPIANAFIAESGTVFMSSSDPASDKTLKWYKASQNLGCGGREAGGKTVDCMRSKPWKAVIEAIKPTSTQGAALGGMGDFGPHADGKVVFSDYKVRAAAGNFIKRPLLVGNNANEAAMFAVILGETTGLKSPALQLASAGFSCPAGDAAKARIDNKVKAWRYVYSGEWPNQDIASGVGAYHGSEIGMVFGTTEYMQTYFSKLSDQNIHFPDTPNQKTLMKTMMTAWASFAKDPENALGKLGWPVYDSSSKSQPSISYMHGRI
jgi:carboxylesterase type B